MVFAGHFMSKFRKQTYTVNAIAYVNIIFKDYKLFSSIKTTFFKYYNVCNQNNAIL